MNAMKRILIKYGIITGVFIILFIIFYYTVFYPLLIKNSEYCSLGLIGLLGSFITTFFGVMEYREKINNRFISFKKAFYIGLLISLIGITLYLLYFTFDYHFMHPSLLEREIAFQTRPERIEELSKLKDHAAIDHINEYKANYSKPLYFIYYTVSEFIPFAFFMSFVSALVLKRKPKNM